MNLLVSSWCRIAIGAFMTSLLLMFSQSLLTEAVEIFECIQKITANE
jgi:hypothetical protein